MKKLLFLTVLSFSTMVMASELPTAITCVSEAKSSAVKSFEITELNTDSPDSTISDSGLLEFEVINDFIVNLSFSNECDNYYGMIFYKNDLIALKAGTLSEVKGLMNYGDVELSERRGTEDSSEETVNVICRLK